jgi:hypothetical protein
MYLVQRYIDHAVKYNNFVRYIFLRRLPVLPPPALSVAEQTQPEIFLADYRLPESRRRDELHRGNKVVGVVGVGPGVGFGRGGRL